MVAGCLPSRTMAATVRSLTCTSRLRRASCALESFEHAAPNRSPSRRCAAAATRKFPVTAQIGETQTIDEADVGQRDFGQRTAWPRHRAGAGIADAGIAERPAVRWKPAAARVRGARGTETLCASAWMGVNAKHNRKAARYRYAYPTPNPASPSDRDTKFGIFPLRGFAET